MCDEDEVWIVVLDDHNECAGEHDLRMNSAISGTSDESGEGAAYDEDGRMLQIFVGTNIANSHLSND